MATDASDRVREIARRREAEESEVGRLSVENGVENRWRHVAIPK